MPLTLQYAVFGTGRIGTAHAKMLLEQGQHIVAIGDPVPAAMDAFCEAIPQLAEVPRYPSAQAIADAVTKGDLKLDAAVIASQTESHSSDSLPFIKLNIPVYCEKPITSDLASAFRFVKQVGSSRRVMQVGFQRHFDEALCWTKHLIDSGVVGEIREIRSVLRDQFPPPPTYEGSRTSRCPLLSDMSCHVVDEVMWLTGEKFSSIWARMFRSKGYTSHLDEGGDCAHVGAITAKSKIICDIATSRTHSSGYNNETYVIGTKGTIHCGRFCGYPGPIPVEVYVDGKLVEEQSRVFSMPQLKRPFPEFLPRFDDAFKRAHKGFREALEAKKEFAITQCESLDVLVAIEAACVSAVEKEGRAVEIKTSDDIEEYWKMCVAAGFVTGEI